MINIGCEVMNKVDFISDYFAGTYAYYLYQMGTFENDSEKTQYILNKEYLNAAKIALISNIMLGIKEDMVENKGNLVYQSKLFINSLEHSVFHIATKVDSGYQIGSYIFPDASTLVAIIRNKLAHGMYTMDLKHNRVILHHKGSDIILNIDKLSLFIVDSFANTINQKMTNKYERNIVYYTKNNSKSENPITDISEVKKMVKNFNAVNFTIETQNLLPVPMNCILRFESFLKNSYINFYDALTGTDYKQMVKFLADNGCKISYSFDILTDQDKINNVLKYADSEIVGNKNLNYIEQIKLLGMEIQKRLNSKYNSFNALASNVSNLVVLSAITKTSSVKYDDISRYITPRYLNLIKIGYDEFGMALISMFNTLFMYPFDDVYSIKGEYTFDKSDGLDFSKLDLSMVNPTTINIDNYPLVNAKEKVNSILRKQSNLVNNILIQENNLNNVKGNEKVELKIKEKIESLRKELSKYVSDYVNAYTDLTSVVYDYSMNKDYFRNKAIIEGIRNSIAHGNYEFVSNGKFSDTIIVFNDIYEGQLTFQAKLTFCEFEQLIFNNKDFLLSFVDEKISLTDQNKSKKK